MESNDTRADDALLRDFFRSELGGELPPLRATAGVDPRWRLRIGVAAAIAAAVVIVVWGAWPGEPAAAPFTAAAFVVTERSEPIERITYPTSRGDVVQETAVKWTTIAMSDPGQGDRIQWSIPEMSIVIEPAAPRPVKRR